MAGFLETPFHPGMRSMLGSPAVRAAVTDVAQRKLDHARSTAPVKTGAYRDGLHLVQETSTDGRARVLVAGGTDHDEVVEANTGNLLRALDG